MLCLQYMMRKVPEIQGYVEPGLHRALGDRDPSVVWASLHGYQHLIQVNKHDVEHFTKQEGNIPDRKLPFSW